MAGDEADQVASDRTAGRAPVVSNISSRRLNTIIAGLWLCLFLSGLDTTIVTTALIKISSDFNALDQSAWLITAYLLTYNCKTRLPSELQSYADYSSFLDDYSEIE